MKQEYKDRWVKALRSGEYTQGKYALKNKVNAFCCLGVLCDVVKDELSNDWVDRGHITNLEFLNTGTSLPYVVQQLVGLTTNNSCFDNTNLIEANDILGYTFNQIADLIEEYL